MLASKIALDHMYPPTVKMIMRVWTLTIQTLAVTTSRERPWTGANPSPKKPDEKQPSYVRNTLDIKPMWKAIPSLKGLVTVKNSIQQRPDQQYRTTRASKDPMHANHPSTSPCTGMPTPTAFPPNIRRRQTQTADQLHTPAAVFQQINRHLGLQHHHICKLHHLRPQDLPSSHTNTTHHHKTTAARLHGRSRRPSPTQPQCRTHHHEARRQANSSLSGADHKATTSTIPTCSSHDTTPRHINSQPRPRRPAIGHRRLARRNDLHLVIVDPHVKKPRKGTRHWDATQRGGWPALGR